MCTHALTYCYTQQVLTVFQERRIMADETTKFEELLAHERERFVEEELRERSAPTLTYTYLVHFAAHSTSSTQVVVCAHHMNYW
jgi:hypothetical protein